ncbi:MAG: helix-turn-helix transcriptional regulator [Nitrospinota bacterium]|nr:helix-turn-helix transcriptional regulator [Nitrospinota bacterium]
MVANDRSLNRCAPGLEAQGLRFGLTRRETETARLVMEGKRNKQIGQMMGISEWTVRTHLANIFHKTGVRSRTELAALLTFEKNGNPSPTP